MTTLGEFAKAYEPKKTHNISELSEVSTDLQLEDVQFTKQDGEVVSYKVVNINGEKYRVPISVVNDLKALLESNPNIKRFKVVKKGTGMATKYTVVPLS